MDVTSTLKMLRKELKLTQADLGFELGCSVVTVNRWETGKNPPNKTASRKLISFAKKSGASAVCLACLQDTLFPSVDKGGIDDLKYARMDQINRLVNDSINAVIVCDVKTRDLLYINTRTSEIVSKPADTAIGKKCYEYLMNKTEPCSGCHMNHFEKSVFHTCEYESPSGRFYMLRGKMAHWNDRPAYLEYITDITDLHNTQTELIRSREMMTAACSDARMWVFSMSLETGDAYLEPIVQNALHLPALVPDFIEYLLLQKIVEDKYAGELRALLPSLRAGNERAEVICRVFFPAVTPHWVRLRAHLTNNGLVICSAQTIDNEKALETRIRFEHEQILSTRKDLMSCVISNLTKNVVLESRKIQVFSPETTDGIPYDEATEQALERIPAESDKIRFKAAHDRLTLLRRFADGQLAQPLDYQYRCTNGHLVWVRSELKLAMLPDSGNILLYEYSFMSHERKIMDGLLALSALGEYIFIGALSLPNGQMTLLAYDEKTHESRLDFKDYDDYIEKLCAEYVWAEDQACFMARCSLDTVKARMEKDNAYRVPFRSRRADGEYHSMIGEFIIIDKELRLCLVVIVDKDQLLQSSECVDADGGII